MTSKLEVAVETEAVVKFVEAVKIVEAVVRPELVADKWHLDPAIVIPLVEIGPKKWLKWAWSHFDPPRTLLSLRLRSIFSRPGSLRCYWNCC